MVDVAQKVSIGETRVEDDEIEAVVEVLRSGALRQGPVVADFERLFAEFVGARHAVAVSSGTAALHLAYLAVLEPGDEVLVPSFTFFATASMVVAAGGKPVFCDVDPSTYTIDLDDAESKITSRTRAIAPVHLFGNAVNVDRTLELAKRHGLKIVWDAAQAHGTEYAGHDIGGLPGVTCYSFYPSKNMTTGEGGMITTDDDEVDQRLRLLRSQGQPRKYYHTIIGFNQRLTDFQAALGRVQLAKLPAWLQRRREIAATLTQAIERVPGLSVQKVEPNSRHAYHQFSLVVDRDRLGMSRDEFARYLQDRGIETGVHYPRPLHQQPVFEEMFGTSSFPVSEMLSGTIISLPVHHNLSDAEVDQLRGAIESLQNR